MQPNSGDGGAGVILGGGIFLYVIILLIHLGLCYAVGKYGENRGQSFWLGALLSFFVSPLIGFIVVLVMKDNRVAR